jgi:phosphoribosylglycinamide formyltransferase 1
VSRAADLGDRKKRHTLSVSFLASHNGSGMRAVLAAMSEGSLQSRPGVVISNNANSPALEFARRMGVPCCHLSQSKLGPAADLDQSILATLQQAGTDIVLLSGYLRRLGDETLAYFRGRVLNVHPSLLPKFGGHGMHGKHVHEAVPASGERETGATVHVVDQSYDTGPIILQRSLSVEAGATVNDLARRVSTIEGELVIEALRQITEGRIDLASLVDRDTSR